LIQRDAERGLERVVEDCIAGVVGKIGENNGVFLGEDVGGVLVGAVVEGG
jgi:hypothetical protein